MAKVQVFRKIKIRSQKERKRKCLCKYVLSSVFATHAHQEGKNKQMLRSTMINYRTFLQSEKNCPKKKFSKRPSSTATWVCARSINVVSQTFSRKNFFALQRVFIYDVDRPCHNRKKHRKTAKLYQNMHSLTGESYENAILMLGWDNSHKNRLFNHFLWQNSKQNRQKVLCFYIF